jgi:hypothetical protein
VLYYQKYYDLSAVCKIPLPPCRGNTCLTFSENCFSKKVLTKNFCPASLTRPHPFLFAGFPPVLLPLSASAFSAEVLLQFQFPC